MEAKPSSGLDDNAWCGMNEGLQGWFFGWLNTRIGYVNGVRGRRTAGGREGWWLAVG